MVVENNRVLRVLELLAEHHVSDFRIQHVVRAYEMAKERGMNRGYSGQLLEEYAAGAARDVAYDVAKKYLIPYELINEAYWGDENA